MTRKKMAAISSVIVILLAASFFVGTLFSSHVRTGMEPQPALMSATGSEPAHAQDLKEQTAVQERAVIYNAYVSLETGDMQGTLGKIRELAQRLGGYVSSSSRSSHGTQPVAEMAIRVPKGNFQAAVQEIETYGKVVDERTTSEDVTQQYIDLKARLSNLQRQEQRLHEILTMAKTVDEILRVESELARVRGEIESLQGRIKYLEGNVEMSLISVLLAEPTPPFTPPGMDWGETLETAIWGLFTVVRGLIIIVVSLTPLALIGLPAYYVYKRRRTTR